MVKLVVVKNCDLFQGSVDKSSSNIHSMSKLDMFEENCHLYNLSDSIHNQHI